MGASGIIVADIVLDQSEEPPPVYPCAWALASVYGPVVAGANVAGAFDAEVELRGVTAIKSMVMNIDIL